MKMAYSVTAGGAPECMIVESQPLRCFKKISTILSKDTVNGHSVLVFSLLIILKIFIFIE